MDLPYRIGLRVRPRCQRPQAWQRYGRTPERRFALRQVACASRAESKLAFEAQGSGRTIRLLRGPRPLDSREHLLPRRRLAFAARQPIEAHAEDAGQATDDPERGMPGGPTFDHGGVIARHPSERRELATAQFSERPGFRQAPPHIEGEDSGIHHGNESAHGNEHSQELFACQRRQSGKECAHR